MYENITVLDLHIHTKYSIACSKDADLKGYAELGKFKGIDIIGTGDMFKKEHLDDIKKYLIPEKKGIYKYNNQKFMLSGEISLIYRESGIVKKVHILLILSSIEAINKIKKKIFPYGKIESTGRPILKLSTEDFVNLVRSSDSDSIIIPAHIWTPHFGILGRKSGYNRLSDAIKNAQEFSAVETGLSSDPKMNRYIEELDTFNMVSFSDAHSPGKLAREFTMIKGNKLDINIIKNAFENKNDRLLGTAEFYPEEGKYYASGHRKCNYYTLNKNEICPVCGKPLTDGVLKRIKMLSGRKTPIKHNKQVIYTLPFDRIVRYIKKKKMGTSLKSIRKKLIDSVPETHLTAFMNGKEIDRTIPFRIGCFMEKIRSRELEFNPGYDGVYGEPIIKEVE